MVSLPQGRDYTSAQRALPGPMAGSRPHLTPGCTPLRSCCFSFTDRSPWSRAAGWDVDVCAGRETSCSAGSSVDVRSSPRWNWPLTDATRRLVRYGFRCAYTNTISWRSPPPPLPMESDPRVVFKRLFGDSGSTDPAVRRARRDEDRSILDSVTDKVRDLQAGVGPEDLQKIDQYLEGRARRGTRIQLTEESVRELSLVRQPVGVPSTFEEHMRQMFDRSDRVVSFMVGCEIRGRPYNANRHLRRAPPAVVSPRRHAGIWTCGVLASIRSPQRHLSPRNPPAPSRSLR